MKPKVNKTSECIEIVGHYDDSVLCAKLTLLADLYAIEHREGYAKFRVEDEDKLRLVDDRLEFIDEPIDDLTGTKWLLNSSLDLSIKTAYGINFVSNDTNYIYFAIAKSPNPKEPIAYELVYYNTNYNGRTVYSAYGGDWVDEVYRTIEITGGTDATNTNLISWLQANAVQQVEPEPTATNTFSLGNLAIANVYFGTLQAKKIYLGNSLVWEKEIIPENILLAQDGALLTSDGGYLITTEVTLISFTINGTSYQAESGMTWAEWCDSEYNTGTYHVINNYVTMGTAGSRPISGVVPTDTIISGGSYYLASGGSDN